MPTSRKFSSIRKPKQPRSRETHRVILKGARLALVKYGYRHITTNRIAERSGVSVGTLYQYFYDKDDILKQTLAAFAKEMKQGLQETLQKKRDLPQETMVRASVSAMVDMFYQHRDFIRVVREELPTAEFPALKQSQSEIIDIMSMFLSLVGDKPPTDVHEKAFIGFMAIDGILMGWLGCDPPPFPKDKLITEISALANQYLHRPS